MAKRPAVRRTRDQAEQSRQSHSLGGSKHGSYVQEESNVRALFGWNPTAQDDGPDRDQSFLKKVKPRTAGQEKLMDAIDSNPLVVAIGPAGTGKTYLAITKAVEALEAGRVSRIVLSRPAVEAGESIGFLPGHMEEKLAPYLRPLMDALSDRLSPKRLKTMMVEGLIEIAPIGFMRGRTLNNAFVVIDEAQNCTYGQLKMLLTRLGWHSTMGSWPNCGCAGPPRRCGGSQAGRRRYRAPSLGR